MPRMPAIPLSDRKLNLLPTTKTLDVSKLNPHLAETGQLVQRSINSSLESVTGIINLTDRMAERESDIALAHYSRRMRETINGTAAVDAQGQPTGEHVPGIVDKKFSDYAKGEDPMTDFTKAQKDWQNSDEYQQLSGFAKRKFARKVQGTQQYFYDSIHRITARNEAVKAKADHDFEVGEIDAKADTCWTLPDNERLAQYEHYARQIAALNAGSLIKNRDQIYDKDFKPVFEKDESGRLAQLYARDVEREKLRLIGRGIDHVTNNAMTGKSENGITPEEQIATAERFVDSLKLSQEDSDKLHVQLTKAGKMAAQRKESAKVELEKAWQASFLHKDIQEAYKLRNDLSKLDDLAAKIETSHDYDEHEDERAQMRRLVKSIRDTKTAETKATTQMEIARSSYEHDQFMNRIQSRIISISAHKDRQSGIIQRNADPAQWNRMVMDVFDEIAEGEKQGVLTVNDRVTLLEQIYEDQSEDVKAATEFLDNEFGYNNEATREDTKAGEEAFGLDGTTGLTAGQYLEIRRRIVNRIKAMPDYVDRLNAAKEVIRTSRVQLVRENYDGMLSVLADQLTKYQGEQIAAYGATGRDAETKQRVNDFRAKVQENWEKATGATPAQKTKTAEKETK